MNFITIWHRVLVLSDREKAWAFLWHTRVQLLSWGRARRQFAGVVSRSTRFFFSPGTPFLFETMTDKLRLFSLGYPVDVFSKMNAVSLALQEKHLTIFCANDKIQACKQKCQFQKTCIRHKWAWQLWRLPQTERFFWWDQWGYLQMWGFDSVWWNGSPFLRIHGEPVFSKEMTHGWEIRAKCKRYQWNKAFHGTKCEKLLEMAALPTATDLSETTLVHFWCNIKEYPWFSEKVQLCIFSNIALGGQIFFLSPNIYSTTYCKRINAAEDRRLSMSSLRPGVKKIHKDVKGCQLFWIVFCFGK